MHILSINVSEPKAASYKGKDFLTGIFKQPLPGSVGLRKTGIDGDGQADPVNHGGPDKAVYAFPSEHHAFYQQRLGHAAYQYGRFGENLTTEGLLESTVRIGDRFRAGTAVLEVSQPRSPCYKLAMVVGTRDVVPLMLESARTGFYCRVVSEGVIEPGEVHLLSSNPDAQSVEAVHRLLFFDIINLVEMEKALANPALGQAWRDEFSKRLSKLKGAVD